MMVSLLLTLSFAHAVLALHGITTPSLVTADQQFQVTFDNGGSDPRDQYRVFLSAASIGQNGPMCYLQNLTSLASPFTTKIPSSVGPNGDDYSIGIADITTSQGATFGTKFNFTGGSGEPTPYERQLGGAPFWNAYNLPCSAMSCARRCAHDAFSAELTDEQAYATIGDCIETCPGVADRGINASNAVAQKQTADATIAIVTVTSDLVVTALKTVLSTDGTAITKAIIGTRTLTAGSAVQTISHATVSFGKDGLIVGESSTVPFSTTTPQATSTSNHAVETIGAQGRARGHDRELLLRAGLAVVAVLAI